MDLKDEEKQFHAQKQLFGAAIVLKVLALLLVVGWIGIMFGTSFGARIFTLLGALAGAAVVWAIALVLDSQAQVEENTRDMANTLRAHRQDDGVAQAD